MKTFELTPRAATLDDRDWDCSISKARCHVMADDETEARLDATLAFGIAARIERPWGATRHNPWSQSRLVEVREVIHPGDPHLTPGHVVTDEWVIDLDRPLDIQTRQLLALASLT